MDTDTPAAAVDTHRSFCRVCHAACPIEVDVAHDPAGDRVVAVRGVKEDPLFEGYTCIKGRQLPDQIHHPDRSCTPAAAACRRRVRGDLVHRRRSTRSARRCAASSTPTVRGRSPATPAPGGYQNSTTIPVARAWHKAIRSRSFYTSLTIDQPAKATAPFLHRHVGGRLPRLPHRRRATGHRLQPARLQLRPHQRAPGDQPVHRAARAQGAGHEADRDRSPAHRVRHLRRHPPAAPARRGPDDPRRHDPRDPRRGSPRRRVLRPVGRRASTALAAAVDPFTPEYVADRGRHPRRRPRRRGPPVRRRAHGRQRHRHRARRWPRTPA